MVSPKLQITAKRKTTNHGNRPRNSVAAACYLVVFKKNKGNQRQQRQHITRHNHFHTFAKSIQGCHISFLQNVLLFLFETLSILKLIIKHTISPYFTIESPEHTRKRIQLWKIHSFWLLWITSKQENPWIFQAISIGSWRNHSCGNLFFSALSGLAGDRDTGPTSRIRHINNRIWLYVYIYIYIYLFILYIYINRDINRNINRNINKKNHIYKYDLFNDIQW